ncbi:MAG: toll/interleukin-1 receptor domain-containing protein [Geminicoccales bacterium]
MADAEGLAESVAAFIPFHTKQAQDVLAHPEIKALAKRFPEHEKRLQLCIEGLSSAGPAETETLVQATKKAFDAVTGKLRVFLSYKRAQHADVARQLRDSLEAFGANRVEVFLDEVRIEAGQDWFNSIKKSLKRANCLVLLVPDDSDEREWPIFEAAFFAGRMLPGERLICLHHPAVQIPRQLAAFQGYKADAAGVEKLLRRLLIEPDVVPGLDAVNPGCKAFLENLATSVAEQFSGPTRLKPRATMNFVTLELSRPGEFSNHQDLLRSKVIDAQGLEDMFFYTGGVGSELRRVLDVRDDTGGRHDVWLAELTDCIRAQTTHRRAEVPFAKFSTPDGKQTFRPVLRQIEEDEIGAAHRLEIVFGEHLIGITDNPDDLQIIEAALRLAARTRGEILTKLSRPRNVDDVERVERILKRIEREAQDEGFRDRHMLTQLFKEADRATIEHMYEEWEHYRNDQCTGKLDKAFAEKDFISLREALKGVKKMNREFTILAVRRYAEMLEDDEG